MPARSPIASGRRRCTSSRSPPTRCGSVQASEVIWWPRPSCIARQRELVRVLVATTNDNLPSLYFYQRKGYRITEILPETMVGAKGKEPSIGFGGIPIRDEIHLTKAL